MPLPYGLALRSIRSKRGLSQRQLSELMHVPRTYVCKIETGINRSITLETLWKFLECLRIKPWTFMRYLYNIERALKKDPTLKTKIQQSRPSILTGISRRKNEKINRHTASNSIEFVRSEASTKTSSTRAA